jgi:hypothetical protein
VLRRASSRCPCRKLNPPLLMEQSDRNGRDDDMAGGPDGAWDRLKAKTANLPRTTEAERGGSSGSARPYSAPPC